MSGRQKSVQVYVDAEGTGGLALMGVLHAQSSGQAGSVFLRIRSGMAGE